MAIPTSSTTQIPSCFASVSLGFPTTPLPAKLAAISAAGFQALELGFPDLLSFASAHLGKDVGPYDFDDLCTAGEEVKRLCERFGLKVLVLQPFSNFEGWAEGSEGREDAFRRAKGWVRVMEAVGTDMLQVGSTDTPSSKLVSPDSLLETVISDLRALSSLLAPHSFRLAYENWCWSTHAPTWRAAWSIVQAVDRDNVGLCLDTFQTAGSEWADPCTVSGLIETHPAGEEGLEKDFRASLEDLADEIPPEKIFFLQISDAYRPPEPLSREVEGGEEGEGMRPRGKWSHDFRPVPFSQGGYLPVVDVTKAVLRTGFRGWFSMEVFDGGKEGKQDWREEDLEAFAKGAMRAHEKLVRECVVEG